MRFFYRRYRTEFAVFVQTKMKHALEHTFWQNLIHYVHHLIKKFLFACHHVKRFSTVR